MIFSVVGILAVTAKQFDFYSIIFSGIAIALMMLRQ